MPKLLNGFTYIPFEGEAFDNNVVRRLPSIGIEHTLNAPSRSTFDVGDLDLPLSEQLLPTIGQEAVIDFGTELFRGPVMSVSQTWENDGQRDQMRFSAVVSDKQWLLNRRLPFGKFTDQPADVVGKFLIDNFTHGFTTTFIMSDLPTISIVFDGTQLVSECLAAVVKAMGLLSGAWYLDGVDVHLHNGTEDLQNPEPIDKNNQFLIKSNPPKYSEDGFNLRTRILIRGAGAKVIGDVAVGDDVVYVDAIDIFPAGSELYANGMRFAFISKKTTSTPQPRTSGGSGSVALGDAGRVFGSLEYYVSNVIGGEESDLNPVGSVVATQVPLGHNAGGIGTATPTTGGSMDPGLYFYYIADVTTDGAIAFIEATFTTINMFGPDNAVQLGNIQPSADPRVSGQMILRSDSGVESTIRVVGSITNGETTFLDKTNSAAASLPPFTIVFPGVFNNTGYTVNVTVDPGGLGTDSRKVYREVIGGNSKQLLTTISGNLSEVYHDNKIVEGSQGAAPPGPYPPIVKFGLYGVTGITKTMAIGDEVFLFLQRDDLQAQLSIGQTEGYDGVHEFPLNDTNLNSIDKMTAAGDAMLSVYSRPIKSVNFETRDPNALPGRIQNFDLPAEGEDSGIFDPNIFDPDIFDCTTDKGIFGDFLIQSSRLSEIHDADDLDPRRSVSAGSTRFTFQDLIQKILLRS